MPPLLLPMLSSVHALTVDLLQPTTTPRVLSRHRPPMLFGDGKPQLADEEYKALAGVWRMDLDLDDGDAAMSMHLAAPTSQGAAANGKVCPAQEEMPFNLGRDWSTARWAAHRTVRAGEEGDDELGLSMSLPGNVYLEGRGQRRDDFRCSTFDGTVFEGGEDPCVVGSFEMELSLPIHSDTSELEARYHSRIASRPMPPLTFSSAGFVGPWRLELAVDEGAPPVDFHIQLHADRSWQSVGTEHTLAGAWGLRTDDDADASGVADTHAAGSRVWLKVQRERSTESLIGIAGLPVRSDFDMWGKPILTLEQEIAARVALSGGAPEANAPAVAHRVDGLLSVGLVEAEYFGRFQLLRGWSDDDELSSSGRAGQMPARVEGVDLHEELRARVRLPTPEEAAGMHVVAAQAARDKVAQRVAKLRADLAAAEARLDAAEMVSADETAEAAKRVWLARIG